MFYDQDFFEEAREEVIKWLNKRDVKRIRETLGKSDILAEEDIEELLKDFRKAQEENLEDFERKCGMQALENLPPVEIPVEFVQLTETNRGYDWSP